MNSLWFAPPGSQHPRNPGPAPQPAGPSSTPVSRGTTGSCSGPVPVLPLGRETGRLQGGQPQAWPCALGHSTYGEVDFLTGGGSFLHPTHHQALHREGGFLEVNGSHTAERVLFCLHSGHTLHFCLLDFCPACAQGVPAMWPASHHPAMGAAWLAGVGGVTLCRAFFGFPQIQGRRLHLLLIPNPEFTLQRLGTSLRPSRLSRVVTCCRA